MACGSSDEKVLADDLRRTKELALSLMKDKRALLLGLQKERKTLRKRELECKELHRQVGELESISCRSRSADSSLERFDVPPIDSPSKPHLECQKENATLLKRISTSEQDVRKARAEIRELENHKVVLEAEVMRLAESLDKSATVAPNWGEGLLKEQLQIYEEDFKKEKGEKVAAEGRVVTLEDTVKDYQELISTLTHEVDMYKSAYERERREKEFVLFHVSGASGLTNSFSQSPEHPTQGTGGSSVTPPHPLQVVYPVVDTTKKEQNQRRKQQLNKVGVFARNSNANDGLFYGGNS